ncbi:MAG: phage tail sheath family protein [Terriglobia bacterium]
MPSYLHPGVYVEEVPSGINPIVGVGTSTAGFIGIAPNTVKVATPNPDYDPTQDPGPGNLAANLTDFALGAGPGEVKLCTSFGDFTRYFGSFSTDSGHNNLVHAVYGFFTNGGTQCYVVRENNPASIPTSALKRFEAFEDIAIVAAPGMSDPVVWEQLKDHCEMNDGRLYRVAILDCPETIETAAAKPPKPPKQPAAADPAAPPPAPPANPSTGFLDLTRLKHGNANAVVPDDSDYAAYYVPWIYEFDPPTKYQNPKGDGCIYVPPSGHVAGIYATVDTERGVWKAPANEVVRGALGLKYRIGNFDQDDLNPFDVNAIRDLNGNLRVWGARTIGGDRNNEWKYLSVRRFFLFLRKSIDQGTQWIVFEVNNEDLWSKIIRNVTAFLTPLWHEGALFGSSPQEAFYVKCDRENNPPEIRDLGQVIIEIGVALSKPAEFVIFRISQWAGPGK